MQTPGKLLGVHFLMVLDDDEEGAAKRAQILVCEGDFTSELSAQKSHLARRTVKDRVNRHRYGVQRERFLLFHALQQFSEKLFE
ncbi:hypothetical protein DF016_10985 [Burkholderia stagnalis]|uniref:Uncharacterized protein n=1 Tax=Burkholderia stagnalis TaxID=1503054 RepID=A0ABX9YRL1_9BURK|nr:hypothetical protein DF017_12565 [Burkholderia stagnalis]RQZ19572.1 hypothetical protein DF016_10985 [Burkholderia stagnalis]